MPFSLPVTPDEPGEGQESVWAYPRPAIAQPCTRHIRVEHRGVTIAETRRAVRTLETSHPPTYYIPPDDVRMDLLRPNGRRTLCEWKGQAVYFDLSVEGERLPAVAWAYPRPTPAFASLAGFIAFYPAPLDGCFVDGERVTPQPGDFYGGWVTSHVAGPFKGVPGSRFW
jgi:uncharacterized protein (DUF427 family)